MITELLNLKFRLFDGVFGASDEMLGAVGAGVDFEKRIADIYQTCRTPKQIQTEFVRLQQDLETEIAEGQRDAREKLLDNFDREVVEKVRINSSTLLDQFNDRLWILARHSLAPFAKFDDASRSFDLTRNPFPDAAIHSGSYRMGKNVEDANTFRAGHPLALRIIAQAKTRVLEPANVVFDYNARGSQDTCLETLVGRSGWLTCARLLVTSVETEEVLILGGITDQQESLDDALCRQFFDIPGIAGDDLAIPEDVRISLTAAITRRQNEVVSKIAVKNQKWLESEINKLNGWADDRKMAIPWKVPASLGGKLAEMEPDIRFDEWQSRKIYGFLAEGFDFETACRKTGISVDTGKNWMRLLYYGNRVRLSFEDDAGDDRCRASIALLAVLAGVPNDEREDYKEIDRQKNARLDEIRLRFQQKAECDKLFTIRWTLQ